jgi:hypothetical protein
LTLAVILPSITLTLSAVSHLRVTFSNGPIDPATGYLDFWLDRIEPRGVNRFVVQPTAADSVTIIAGTATDDSRRIGDPARITAASEIQLDTAGHVFIVVAGRSAASSKPFAFEVAAQ